MLRGLFDLAPRFLTLLPPEEAHEVTLLTLEWGSCPRAGGPDHPDIDRQGAESNEADECDGYEDRNEPVLTTVAG